MTNYLSSISSWRNCHDNPFPTTYAHICFFAAAVEKPERSGLTACRLWSIVTISICEIFGSLDIQKENYRI